MTNVPAEEIKFNLSCKVTGQVLINTENGISEQASRFKDGLEVGDIFTVDFRYASASYSYLLYIKINVDLIASSSVLSSEDSSKHSDGLMYTSVYEGFGGRTSFLSDDSIQSIDVVDSFNLKRYYRNDFELIHSDNAVVGWPRRTLTANCMNAPSILFEVISEIKAIDKNKWGR